MELSRVGDVFMVVRLRGVGMGAVLCVGCSFFNPSF